MEENRARRVADALRDRGIDAHLETAGIDIYGVRVVLSGGREAIWGNEGTSSLEAEVLLDGDLVGFIPEIPGSAASTRRRSWTPSRGPTMTRPSAGKSPRRRRRPAADARGRGVPPLLGGFRDDSE